MKSLNSEIGIAFVLAALFPVTACMEQEEHGSRQVCFSLETNEFQTRAMSVDEQLISDVNLLLFNNLGTIEKQFYLRRWGHLDTFRLDLLYEVPYHLRIVANLGYPLETIGDMEELETLDYRLDDPGRYPLGVPMTASFDGVVPTDVQTVRLPLERAVAKISVSLDKSALAEGVHLKVESLSVRNCPERLHLFRPSRVEGPEEVHREGFTLSGWDIAPLNREKSPHVSDEAGLYLLENRQGVLLPGIQDVREKLLDDPGQAACCPYIELVLSYLSDQWTSRPGDGLTYRFYLGEGASDFTVERNVHYHYVVRPRGDGLQEFSWRVDKSGLVPRPGEHLVVHPSGFLEARPGETVRLWAETDLDVPIEWDQEVLRASREAGKYDFMMDTDGRGVTLHLKRSGTFLLPVRAGDFAVTVVISVGQPFT